MSDRGHRGHGYVLLTPANRYASRLPWLPDALVYKLVSPRLEPAAFSQQLICLDHAPRAPAALPSGCEQFIYVLSGELQTSVDGSRHDLLAGSFEYCPAGSDNPARVIGAETVNWVAALAPVRQTRSWGMTFPSRVRPRARGRL